MSDDRGLAGFMALVSGINPRIMPPDDAKDVADGATHIPYEVTDARRAGMIVTFVREGAKPKWYWQFPNGKKIPHGNVP